MIIDQSEIDSMLATVKAHAPRSGGRAAGDRPRRVNGVKARGGPSSELSRLLRLRVPVIVRLAHRMLPTAQIMRFCPGWIIEFDTPGDAELDVMINNAVIGTGTAVKVGENFGVRVLRVRDVRERISSMGGS